METKIKVLFLFMAISMVYSYINANLYFSDSKTFNIMQPPRQPLTTSLFDNFTNIDMTIYGDDMANNPPIILGTLMSQAIANNIAFPAMFQNSQLIKLLAHFNCPGAPESCVKFNFSSTTQDLCLLVGSVDGYDRVSISSSDKGVPDPMKNWTMIYNGSFSETLPPAEQPALRNKTNQIQLGCFSPPTDNVAFQVYKPDKGIDHLELCYKSYDIRSQYVYYAFIKCQVNNPTPSPQNEQMAISGYAFLDRMLTSKMGIGNPGLPGVSVNLLTSSGRPAISYTGSIVQPTVTDSRGYYYFDNLRRGLYLLKFTYSVDGFSFSTIQSLNQSEPLTNKVNQTGVTFPVRLTLTAPGTRKLTPVESMTIHNAADGILPEINAGILSSTDGFIDGTVFVDYNANGIMDIDDGSLNSIDIPKPGINVTLYDSNGLLISQLTTDQNGRYNFTYLPYNIQFTVTVSAPDGWVKTRAPTNPPPGKLSVSPLTSLNPSGTVNFGVVATNEVCQPNPSVALVCYSKGAYNGTNGDDPVLISFPLNSKPHLYNDTTNVVDHLASYKQVGAVYGVGWMRSSGDIFVSAFNKYYTTFGPSGNGAIYRIKTTEPHSVLCYFDINKVKGANYAGNDTHLVPLTNYDTAAPSIGKTSYGDLDTYDNKIYATLLQTKELLTLSAFDNSKYTLTPIYNPCIDYPDDWRPFGIGIDESTGQIYIGGVCSMESSPNTSSVPIAYVLIDDQVVLKLDLDYPKGCKQYGNGFCIPGNYKQWSDNFYDPQPMLSDITIEGDTMIISLRDRGGDMDIDVGTYDMHMACRNSTGQWEWEYKASCGGKTGAHPLPSGYFGREDGIGGGEFFDDNFFYPPDNTGHDNVAATSAFFIPGYRYLFGSSLDIDTVGQGAFKVWDKNNGTFVKGVGVYKLDDDPSSLFGKANGLGDTEVLCKNDGL